MWQSGASLRENWVSNRTRSFSCRSQLELCLFWKGPWTSPLQKATSHLLSSVGKSEGSPSSPVSARVDEAFQDLIMFDSYTECGRKRLLLLSWQRSGKNLVSSLQSQQRGIRSRLQLSGSYLAHPAHTFRRIHPRFQIWGNFRGQNGVLTEGGFL